MKKYILLFWIFCLWLINYSFADTIWDFSSSSDLCYVNISLEEDNWEYLFPDGRLINWCVDDFDSVYYMCISTFDVPYTVSGYFVDSSETYNITDNVSCDFVYKFYDDFLIFNKDISWKIYISSSEITYSWTWSCQWLIDPNSCPVCESTFSTLFVNWTQITGSSNIYISIPDHFEYTPTYYTGYMDLDIENVGDPDYIENMLAIQTYRPTSDEFAVSFVWGLTLIMPYILITLFVLFIWRIIRKVFK